MAHILIIDDQPHLGEFLAEDLADEGHHLTCVEDADSVFGLLRESRPDLILLDLYLQGFEGFDLLRDIKRQEPNLPVLILSAYDSFLDDPRLAAADGYVIKDIDTEKLREKIAEVLKTS